MAEVAILVASLAVSAGSAYSANQNQRRAVSSQNAALTAQREQNELQAARQRRDVIRTSRVARARATNAAASQGVMGSSGNLGGLASIQAQLGSNLSFLDSYNRLSDVASEQLGRANTYTQRAETASSVGRVAMQVAGNSAPLGAAFDRMFKGG
jgi:hypothetical protein